MKHDNQAAFSNKDIVEPTKHKPHIVLLRGYWRVSAMPKRFTQEQNAAYRNAHSFANKLNVQRFEKTLKE